MDTSIEKVKLCVPGQRICKAGSQYTGGNGTYLRGGYLYSSLAGYIELKKQNQEILVEVKHGTEQNIVPTVGSVVTAKITTINPRFCKCAILCVEDTVLKEPFRGMIRKEDVRAKEKDKVEIYKSFRPGDIILARLISMGDAHSYILSTAENELGVVIAHSETGALMVPASWTEMMCTKTCNKEPRKVAKVVPENFATENT